MKINQFTRAALLAAALSVGNLAARAADISGAGATFPFPVYAKWADSYKKETDTSVNYQSIGSGGGIKQIKAGTVTFGASDAPLTEKDLNESGLVQWPMVMGAIVPVVNLAGVKPGELVAILGIGGLGHLGIQFAARMGLKVAAIARGVTGIRLGVPREYMGEGLEDGVRQRVTEAIGCIERNPQGSSVSTARATACTRFCSSDKIPTVCGAAGLVS